jgi:CRISPR-associated protein Cas1
MSVIYVREQGATIRKQGEQLRVTLNNRELFIIPLANLEQVILLGNVQLTTQAAILLLRSGVDVVFMSQYGKYRGRLLTLESKFAKLRHLQLRFCDDEARSLAVARSIVMGKVQNQRVIMQRRAAEGGAAQRAVDGMMRMLRQANTTQTLDQLRGFEGKAAAFYFEAVRTYFSPEWGFKERAYHPPPDPANGLLSFAYTLLLKDVEAKIQLVGLDPYLGFFHALAYDRPSLALDLMEEFRPTLADVVVLNLVSSGKITLQDFEWTNDKELPVRMTRAAMQMLVEAYEKRLEDRIYHPLANGLTDYRRAIELQARAMARLIRGEAETYAPLVMK